MKFVQVIAFCVLSALLAGCSAPHEHVVSKEQPKPTASVQEGPVLLDVRTAEEFDREHLAGAINVPVDDLEQRITAVVPGKDTPVKVHCQAGGRSARATKKLQKLGYTNVEDLGSYESARKYVNK